LVENGPSTQGPAPDPIQYSGGFSEVAGHDNSTYRYGKFVLKNETTEVGFFLPPRLKANPALIVAFFGTGEDSYSVVYHDALRFGALAKVDQGFVLVAPGVGTKNTLGRKDDPDHFDPKVKYATSWNVWDPNPDTNRDLLVVRAVIDSAIRVFGVDPRRVYLVGHSNGAFFSYFAAMVLRDRVAAFVSSSGGAFRADANRGSTSFTASDAQHLTVAALQSEAGYPAWALPKAAGPLRPIGVPQSGRVPYGYLFHGVRDPIVSVAFTCILSDALGPHASTHLGDYQHLVPMDLASRAWAGLSQHRLP
jgi:poly(3-hydroxybutyrate) depolymerase